MAKKTYIKPVLCKHPGLKKITAIEVQPSNVN